MEETLTDLINRKNKLGLWTFVTTLMADDESGSSVETHLYSLLVDPISR